MPADLKWYGANAGQEFTKAWAQNLIHELQEVTPARVREHQTWLRHNMHKWWQERWVAPAPVYPQGVAQHSSAPEGMMWTTEDSEQVLRQQGYDGNIGASNGISAGRQAAGD